MYKFFKMLFWVVILMVLVFMELALLISDYAHGENQTTRLIAMVALAGFGLSLFWLLFGKQKRVFVLILVLISAIAFALSALLPEKLSSLLDVK